MTIPTPRFTGIFIPSEILDHPDLTLLEQLLLSWIDALYCREHRGCYAKNEYFAQRLKVKENTIAKALTDLRKKGLIEDVAFDGRNRVIRAKISEYVQKSQSNAGLDLNPMQGWTEIQGSIGEKSIDTYIESKEEAKEDITPPIPPQIPVPEIAAKAASGEVPPSSKKPSRVKPDFSPKARETGQALLNVLIAAKPDFKVPTNLFAFLTEVDCMIRTDKRDPEKLVEVLRWGLSDPYQGPWFFCANPAKKLRQKYDAIDMKMIIKTPEPKKERKFAPCSDDQKALEKLNKMDETAI